MPKAAAMKWLSEGIIPQQEMTDSLREIWTSTPEAAEKRIAAMKSAASSASVRGRLAAALLTAVANERAGKRDTALGEYHQLAVDGKDTPFGISASFRASVLEGHTSKEKLAASPVGDGWFLVSDAWTWTSRQAAAEEASAAAPFAAFSWGMIVLCFFLGFILSIICMSLASHICSALRLPSYLVWWIWWLPAYGVGQAMTEDYASYRWAYGIAVFLAFGLVALAEKLREIQPSGARC
jgi:hypothetical protein